MSLLFFLIATIVLALMTVSVINVVQQRERNRKIRRHKLRSRIESLEETLDGLLNTLANPQIAKHINDEILFTLAQLAALDGKNAQYLLDSIENVEKRGVDIKHPKARRKNNYLKHSDLEIAQAQLYLNRALLVLRHKHAEGQLTDDELATFTHELLWTQLMVAVMSIMGQGYKATERGDFFNAHAFYKKAQHLLIESEHPNPRRMTLIKELSEVMSGARDKLSDELINF